MNMSFPKSMSAEEVGDWVASVGFPMYKSCFVENGISGKRLMTVNASKLPKLGITDFEHIKCIAHAIRELFQLEAPDCERSVSCDRWTPRSSLELGKVGYKQEFSKDTAPMEPVPRWLVQDKANDRMN
eukprot:m.341587 g.341587  ORF g.341587 m.341587 type:complete len:128 (-) comp20225_c0_seq1:17-400(-)